jgi:hypothetical protein
MTKPRYYEIRKTQKWSRQSTFTERDTLAEAVAKAEEWGEEDGYVVRIREYELSGMPGLRPIRPDRLLSLADARAELEAS